MNADAENLSSLERAWDAGQRHLVAGRYIDARRSLENAETLAWRNKDAPSLARLYLPLLEARRQIRYNAAEGAIILCPSATGKTQQKLLKTFLQNQAGTFLISSANNAAPARRLANAVAYASRRLGRCLEALLLITPRHDTRLTTSTAPTFAAGLPVQFTAATNNMIGPSTESHLIVPLPPPALYKPGAPLHALARESLIVAWEALALNWQRRHPLRQNATPWDEITWLRNALRIDPACEPITMRLMSLLEFTERL